MRALATGLVATLSILAFGQKSTLDTRRVDIIWDTAQERISHQIDVWFDDGDYPRCTNTLRFQVAADPTDYFANSNLGWMLENMQCYDEALALYVKFRKENPKQADSAFPEANFYFLHRAYAKVLPLIVPTLDLKPHPNSYRILAHSYDKLGLLTDAERVWKRLILDHPEDDGTPAAKANLAKVERKISTQGKSGR